MLLLAMLIALGRLGVSGHGALEAGPLAGLPDVSGNRVTNAQQKGPLAFVPNRGQVDGDVRYEARGAGFGFHFTPTKAVFALSGKRGGQALHLHFLGASAHTRIEPGSRLDGTVNYLHGDDRARWKRNLPTYAGITYRELWPGIDLRFRGSGGVLKYEFLVRPEASPSRIRLAYAGATGLSLTRTGGLAIHTPSGRLSDDPPRSYQKVRGQRVAVESRFRLLGRGNGYGFDVGRGYDTRYPLLIDPGLGYSTFLGASGFDSATAVAVDHSGNAYVTGAATSLDFPTTPGAFDTAYNGGQADVFVTKLNARGSELIYSTYLGGSARDSGQAQPLGDISVDGRGYTYVAGKTQSSDFPTTPGAFDTTYNGGGFGDAFVAKLDESGSRLLYSTFLGGSRDDALDGITIEADGNGHAYVAGSTASPDFPTTAGAFDTIYDCAIPPDAQCDSFSDDDAFITKLNPAGSALVYSTYLGGRNSFDNARDIALDPAGSAYVTGAAGSTDFPTTAGAYDRTANSQRFPRSDAFITKLNPAGSDLVYSTFLGGSAGNSGSGIDVDGEQNAFVVGQTTSTDFPTTADAFDPVHNAGGIFALDAFVTKLNTAGSAIVYSTFLGGSLDEFGTGIAVGDRGHAHVSGDTKSADFPTSDDALDPSYNGGEGTFTADAFVTELNPEGSSLVHSTFLGGSGFDSSRGIALDDEGSAYVPGFTGSLDFPITPGVFDSEGDDFNGDSFVTKLVFDRDADTPCEIKGSGRLDSNPAARFNIAASFEAGSSAPTGRATYTDRSAAFRLVSRRITSVIGTGALATIRGAGTANGSQVDFRIDVEDGGRPARSDRFEIRLSSGYSASGALRSGHLDVACNG